MATSRTSRRKPKEETEEKMLRLYEPFRFLEAEHWGEFLAVAPDGRWVLGKREIDAIDEAYVQFGAGSTIFKVGDVVVGTWPWYKEL